MCFLLSVETVGECFIERTYHGQHVQRRHAVAQTAVRILTVEMPASDLPVRDRVVESPRDVKFLEALPETYRTQHAPRSATHVTALRKLYFKY